MPTVNELLDKAKTELSNFLPGEVFLVRDLIKGYEWNRIPHSDRLLLDTLFLNFIKIDDMGLFRLEKHHRGSRNIGCCKGENVYVYI